METTGGSITSQEMGYTVEQKLFTYSEEEQLENRINREQAELVLKPKFIPLYPKLLQNGYGLVESVLLGFIDFFLESTNRFYCTNDQLAQMLNCTPQTISTAIKSLEKRGDIELHKKIRAGGGTIRFITLGKQNNHIPQNQKIGFGEVKKLDGIENKIIENNIIDNNYSFQDFRKEFPHARKGKKSDSEKYFKQNDSDSVKKQVSILNRSIKAGLQDAEYVPACERRIRDFTPLSEDVIKQKLIKICKWHLNAGGDMKQRALELKQTFGEQEINEIVKAIQQKDSPKNLFLKQNQ